MFPIIAAIIGFFQAMAPDLMKFQQDKKDKAHELAIMQLQMQMQEKGLTQHLEEVRVASQQLESKALQQSYRAELKYSGKYSAGVRPTITYMAMGLYVIQKIILIFSIVFAPTLPWLPKDPSLAAIAVVIWTTFDETMLSWIIGFWFGSRQLKNSNG